jgi:hypothetical protein
MRNANRHETPFRRRIRAIGEHRIPPHVRSAQTLGPTIMHYHTPCQPERNNRIVAHAQRAARIRWGQQPEQGQPAHEPALCEDGLRDQPYEHLSSRRPNSSCQPPALPASRDGTRRQCRALDDQIERHDQTAGGNASHTPNTPPHCDRVFRRNTYESCPAL